jgi:hypothetical protein
MNNPSSSMAPESAGQPRRAAAERGSRSRWPRATAPHHPGRSRVGGGAALLAGLILATSILPIPEGGRSRAADPPAATVTPPADRHPELRRLAPAEEVWVDLGRKKVVVGGAVALDRGPIEFFACPQLTKEHESVIAVKASARLVHAALLAIGLEPGKPVSFDPVYAAASGPAVRLTLRWKDDAGTVHEADARTWVRNARTGRELDTEWVFAGSSLWKDPDGVEHYQADAGDFICVSNFPTATLDLPIESSQSNEALLFEAFPGRVPPVGTPVDIVLTAARPAAQR